MSATSSPYPFKATEAKWQKIWSQHHTNQTPKLQNSSDKKLYILEMLPYPSGKIHMGHVRNYTIGDVVARFKKAQGMKILHPMGWDAFGMPAENAATQHHIHPKKWTYENIEAMKKVLISLGYSYDWDREVTTCAPAYYGLEQKIFLDLFAHGLIDRKESFVNWDPVDQTVLANEQVIDGRGWRSGALVIKKKIPHWCVRITKYADELLQNLDDLKGSFSKVGWPEKVLTMQRNWIGKSEGLETVFPFVSCPILDQLRQANTFTDTGLCIFTTRPETLFGASFCAIAPDHPLASSLAKQNPNIDTFIQKCLITPVTESAASTTEKLGMDTGIFVTNPVDPNQKLSVFIANFVLSDYGSGAIFACPAHDERDFEFAKKYDLPIISVIQSNGADQPLPYIETSGIMFHSDFLNGLNVLTARKKILDEAEIRHIGHKKTTYRLRDWTVSRQRYWGCPIPMIHCSKCGIVPVPKEQLPILLPDDVTFDKPGNPLDHHPTWKHTKCPKCGQDAQRETDTLDTFFESSWYFLRYCCPHDKQPVNAKEIAQWMPVDIYIGGIEHAVLHLLYARFFTMALNDMGYFDDLPDGKPLREPFSSLLTQGMVCHASYKDKDGKWLYPSEVERQADGQYTSLKTGEIVTVNRTEKMSKSKNNVVDPGMIMDAYGVDALRLFMMSDTPYDKDLSWSTEALEGAWRYLNKVWRLCHKIKAVIDSHSHRDELTCQTLTAALERSLDQNYNVPLLRTTHKYFSKMTQALDQFSFHTALAFHREWTHAIEDGDFEQLPLPDIAEILFIWIMALFPFTPHFSSEIFEMLLACQPENVPDFLTWPPIRSYLVQETTVTIAVQVCGKLRGTFEAPLNSSQEFLKEESLKLENVQRFIRGKNIVKTIIVPDKLVNIVIS